MSQKVRAWIFTANRYDTVNLDFSGLSHVRYASWQEEEVTHRHLQGYIELSTPQRFSYFAAILPGAHWEPRRGSREQAREYTRKEESRVSGPYEYGRWELECGKRNDIAALKRMLDEGKNELQIMEEDFGIWIKHYKSIERFHLIKTTKRNWKSEVTLLVGTPGCGKSKWCLENAPNAYWKDNNKWWDGYHGQEDVVIDDYYGWLPFSLLLRLMDRYPMAVETKGGNANFLAKRIFITSNKMYDHWYKDANLDDRALKRRIDHLYMSDDNVLVNKDSLLGT